MYHYVYRITNTTQNKHYYGKRSCKTLPSLDLGVKYFSSSSDELFIQDQKQNPQNYKYKIIRVFVTSKDAIAFEIRLHNKFDVGINENFYNKSKQTSVGFCFNGSGENNPMYGKTGVLNPLYGKTRSDATKQKMSEAKTGENNPMYGKTGVLNPFYGKTHSDEFKQKLSEAKTGENNPMYGKTPSDVTKQKLSEAKTGENNPMYGTMWVTNGASNLKIKKTDNIPDGYYKGRVIKINLNPPSEYFTQTT